MEHQHQQKRWKRADLLIIGVLLLAALLSTVFLWLQSRDGDDRIAVIAVSGETVREINLTQNKATETFSLEGAGGHTVTFSLEGSRICFVDAQCPDKVCQNTGWVEEPGQSAVCLPFETSLRVYLASEWTDH